MSNDRLNPLLIRARHFVRWLRPAQPSGAGFHFVQDYDRLITRLLAFFPFDRAMMLATGAGGQSWEAAEREFEHFGAVQCALLRYAGLRDGMSLIDFGCGSGRLAAALGKERLQIDYHGIDIDQRLLDYAKTKSPADFRFTLNQTLKIPAADESADMICAFSVFTHLHQTEMYLYLKDMHRVLRPGGRLVFSFFEFASPRHWDVFQQSADAEARRSLSHLNEFIERSVIDLWCEKLGYEREMYIDADSASWGGPGPLGQSAAIVHRSKTMD